MFAYVGSFTTAKRKARGDGISDRGHDSVALFAADAADGSLTPLGWQATHGHGPRFITLDPSGRFLYAANEQSDTDTGALTPTGQVIANGSPVAIVFAE
jgi:6-phosphogluconolactonase (cycloisomerase 2 family)